MIEKLSKLAQRSRKKYRAGFTLIELMMALGIFGLLVAFTVGAFVEVEKFRHMIDDNLNKILIARQIMLTLDCDATVVSNCVSSPFIPLRSANSAVTPVVNHFDPS